MNRVWWEDPVPVFDATADVTPQIRTAVDAANPKAALDGVFGWVSADARRRFLMQVHTREEDFDVLVARFQHTVRSEYSDRYGDAAMRLPWTRVEVAWLVLFGLLAVALVVGAVLST